MLVNLSRAPHRLVTLISRRAFSMTSPARRTLLIEPSELKARLSGSQQEHKNVRIIDATWYMPSDPPRRPKEEFLKGPRIAGVAGFFDVDDVADKTHPLGLKHMMPSPEVFADACGKLGISKDSQVVVYDRHSVFSSPRTAFTFRAFGHENVHVLQGGFPRWVAEGFPVEDGDFKPPFEPCTYPVPQLDPSVIRSYEQIVANTKRDPTSAETELVLDARPAGRYTGEAPEPRPGLSSGHMPNSVSLPFNDLRTAPSATSPPYQDILPRDELRTTLLKALGGDEKKLEEVLNGERSVVNSCGSGMTAAVIWLALQELGVRSAIYDEGPSDAWFAIQSWTGYAMRKESEILKS